ncbi:nucleoside hydrolase [Heyndrickxia sp. FSL K6-6286]|uniref:Nucleoside hydrolase n=1 Tax=Heyndrickxia oleronia TaxID=38875 RepID=A0AAW6STV1_9BACI|nr:nucleoside hydrolase [Heyndrickxia oleronia]MDH5161658.1 nucleoside hydrolase [Heyndrickxia oleronia]
MKIYWKGKNMKNIIIDCDPGHDDALAILTAIANSNKLNILGVTTIGGNQTLEKVTTNAKNILEFVNSTIPLAMGQSEPLTKDLCVAPEAHGESGMDGPYFNGEKYPITSNNAILFMYETIMKCNDKVILVGLGPLTNIALLIKVFPEVRSKIEYISIMGGGLDRGNKTPLAEFNIYVDPEAAQIVFHSGIPVVMSGLDVTEQAEITIEEINSLKNKGRVSHLAYELLHFYNKSGRQFGFINSPIHDLCAVAYILNPKMFSGTSYYVDVVTEGKARGLTFADKRLVANQAKNILVLEKVNREMFISELINALEVLDEI